MRQAGPDRYAGRAERRTGPSRAERRTGSSRAERPRAGFQLTGLLGVLVLLGVTAVGALANGLAGGEPGLILDFSLIAGTVLAAFLIEVRMVWVIIPVPPLVFSVMCVAAGVVGDQFAATTTTRLVTAAGTWVVKGFVAMAVATLLAILITVVRMAGRRN